MRKAASNIFIITLVGFAVRLAFMLLLSTYQFNMVDDFSDGGETANIAMSIATGHGFSSPFGSEYTGPTAWIGPVYPYSLALIFKYAGGRTPEAFALIFTLQSLFSALTVIPIIGIAGYTVGRRAGFLAAWTWALFPWFSKWAVTWVWEVSLSTLLLSLLVWYGLRLCAKPHTQRDAIGFGALLGFALLVNPALIIFIPIFFVWYVFTRQHNRKWITPALAVGVCLLIISPWIIRNRVAFGHWVFLRGNFGLELYQANYHTSNGRGWAAKHPMGNPAEYADYKQMGEVAYVQSRQAAAARFVQDYPGEFIKLTAKRVLYFWDGSAMHYRGNMVARYWLPGSFLVLSLLMIPALLYTLRTAPYGWQIFAGLLVLYPAPYYLTFDQVRYRHALEPFMLLLIAYAIFGGLRYVSDRVYLKMSTLTYTPSQRLKQR